MNRTPQSERAEYARKLRHNGEFTEAAFYYLAAAQGWFMRSRNVPGDNMGEYSLAHFGYGIQDLTAAILCCRIAEKPELSNDFCEIGIINTRLLRDHDPTFQEADSKAYRGLFEEIHGDFSILGNLSDSNQHYTRATSIYKDVENHRNWQAESEFHSTIQTVLELGDSAGIEITESERSQIEYESLTKRVMFKQKHYPEIIKGVLQNGNWDSEVI